MRDFAVADGEKGKGLAGSKHRMAAASDPTATVIRVAERADDLMIVVAGGVGRKAAYAPTWGGTTKAISREIKFRN